MWLESSGICEVVCQTAKQSGYEVVVIATAEVVLRTWSSGLAEKAVVELTETQRIPETVADAE
jgi:hypothetical protein